MPILDRLPTGLNPAVTIARTGYARVRSVDQDLETLLVRLRAAKSFDLRKCPGAAAKGGPSLKSSSLLA
jgi:hypothetical protein